MKQGNVTPKKRVVILLCTSLMLFGGALSTANAEIKKINPDCTKLIIQLNWTLDSARASVFAAGQALGEGDLDGAIDAYDDYKESQEDQWHLSESIEDNGCL